ncbi:hypothetical protein DSM104635_03365 [Terricaulis silvestris]|uniref:Uncharacterized protein n=2 Tax=Terricaulis silvestris TaxID=2686094 RepID=A0A6I6MM18_9CAUL|nr:hypothetical protein DSM104635_03365 [Terricaulis silvestris]
MGVFSYAPFTSHARAIGRAPAVDIFAAMSKPDLEAVIARRMAVQNELSALEKMRAEMEAEDQDLVVAERVLQRLAGRGRGEAPAAET